jgi:hypothetical protein
MAPTRWPVCIVLLSFPLATGAGCAEDCLDQLNTSCKPLYEPTFSNVYNNTLVVSCAIGNGTCHTVDGQSVANNLSFGTEDSAYAGLTGQVDGVKRAVAGEPECSLMIQRLESSDADVQMPPGKKLPEAERCAIIQWVDRGTPR